MRFIFGMIVGVLITVGTAYVYDASTVGPGPDNADRRMVNWGNVHQNLHDLGANISAEWKVLSDSLRAKV